MTNHVMGAAASNNHTFFVIDGISVRRDVLGRYCLNDLHRASGSLDRHKPAFWLRNEQTAQLIGELQNSNSDISEPVSVIRGGNEQGTYVCRELVYAYAKKSACGTSSRCCPAQAIKFWKCCSACAGLPPLRSAMPCQKR